MQLSQFRDTLSHIDVSPAGHQIKLSISHIKVYSALFPVNILLEATYVDFRLHSCRDAPFSNYDRLQSEWLIDLSEVTQGSWHCWLKKGLIFFVLRQMRKYGTIPYGVTNRVICHELNEGKKQRRSGWLQMTECWIAKRTKPKNRMQMMISPTKLIQHQRGLRELEGI